MSGSTPSIAADHRRIQVIAAGVLRDAGGRVLITQRPPGTHMAGLWEFPGGKVESGETVEEALDRELDEEIGVRTVVARLLTETEHCYVDRIIRLHVYMVTVWQGKPVGRETQALRWVTPEQLDPEVFPAADLPIIELLREL
jgi:8-oxo-dGTP diphosphatase